MRQDRLHAAPYRDRGGKRTGHVPAAGFTLIEVLVALAIVATALVAGLNASAAVERQSRHETSSAVAKWCIDNMFTQMRLTHTLPPVGDQRVSCEQAGRSYAGEMSVRPTDNARFRRVELAFSDEDGYAIVRMVTLAGSP